MKEIKINRATLEQALKANGCERILDFYAVGPVQRAAVESFAEAIRAAALEEAAGVCDERERANLYGVRECADAVRALITNQTLNHITLAQHHPAPQQLEAEINQALELPRITANSAQCRLCGTTLHSRHRRDFQQCSCGEIYIDGGTHYLRRGAKNFDNFIDLSQIQIKDQNVRSTLS